MACLRWASVFVRVVAALGTASACNVLSGASSLELAEPGGIPDDGLRPAAGVARDAGSSTGTRESDSGVFNPPAESQGDDSGTVSHGAGAVDGSSGPTCTPPECVVIDCEAEFCPSPITCPASAKRCEVVCKDCAGGVVCESEECAVSCRGTGSCASPLTCTGSKCSVACSGVRSCAGGVACTSSSCALTCSGVASCAALVTCESSSCVVDCRIPDGGSACGDGACCKATSCKMYNSGFCPL